MKMFGSITALYAANPVAFGCSPSLVCDTFHNPELRDDSQVSAVSIIPESSGDGFDLNQSL
jgi:hypothetical protein